jgi:hypothetical protein
MHYDKYQSDKPLEPIYVSSGYYQLVLAVVRSQVRRYDDK